MQAWDSKRTRDQFGGILVTAIGVAVTAGAVNYDIGSLGQMGPGFFPLAIGVLITLTGIALFFGASPRDAHPVAATERRPIDWRGPFCIVFGIVAFLVLGKYGGLLPATFALVFVSAMGDRRNSVRSAVILSAAMVAVCFVVFAWLLQVQFPIFSWG